MGMLQLSVAVALCPFQATLHRERKRFLYKRLEQTNQPLFAERFSVCLGGLRRYRR